MSEISVYESQLLIPEMSAYDLHKWVWSQMEGSHESRCFIYNAVHVRNGWLTHIRTPENLMPQLQPRVVTFDTAIGAEYGFSVRTVPYERHGRDSQDDSMKRRVRRILLDSDARPWFSSLGERNGFAIKSLDDPMSQGFVFFGKHRRKITLNDTLFTGALAVTDSERFTAALRNGIGRHKGFGFGLLQLSEV